MITGFNTSMQNIQIPTEGKREFNYKVHGLQKFSA